MLRPSTFAPVALAAVVVGCGDNERRLAPTLPLAHLPSVTSVKLAPRLPSAVRRECEQLRRWSPPLRVTLYGPTAAIPTPRLPGGLAAQVNQPFTESRGEVYYLSFSNGFDGNDPEGALHWAVGAGTRKAFTRLLAGIGDETPGKAKPLRSHVIDGVRVHHALFEAPRGGPDSGHVIAYIRDGDQVLLSSVHGREHLDAADALVLSMAPETTTHP